MRMIILFFVFSILLFSYEKGDVVEDTIKQNLKMKNNKIYVIDFFASWCNSCKKEIPYISKVNKQIDQVKFEIIGVDVDKDPKKAEVFQKGLKQKGNLNFRVVNDPANQIIKHFAPIGMPALYIVKNGKVVDYLFGARDHIDQLILKVLKEME